jgi:hypothetical protein
LVVHQNPDEYKSPPAGDTGLRIACGVITVIEQLPGAQMGKTSSLIARLAFTRSQMRIP